MRGRAATSPAGPPLVRSYAGSLATGLLSAVTQQPGGGAALQEQQQDTADEVRKCTVHFTILYCGVQVTDISTCTMSARPSSRCSQRTVESDSLEGESSPGRGGTNTL